MNTEMDEQQALVMDIGSSQCKVGFAGDDAPQTVFPAIIGRAHVEPCMRDTTVPRDAYIGEHAQRYRDLYSLSYPMERGVVRDWKGMERLWGHALYNELRINPRDYPILCTEPPLNPKVNREIMCETMFESLDVLAFYVQMQAILSMYASGRGSGVMLDSGDGVTHVIPVYEGYCTKNAIQRVDLAGKDMNGYLARLLAEKGYSFVTLSELEQLRAVKEDLCYVCQDYQQQLTKSSDDTKESYRLPDGRYISVGNEAFRMTEALFYPYLIGLECLGFHELVYRCIMKCDIDTRKDLAVSVILSGGNSMFRGLAQRLQKELQALCPPTLRVKIVAAPERKYNVWIGGSIMASLSTFQQMWITRQEYNEHGSQIVHKKCI